MQASDNVIDEFGGVIISFIRGYGWYLVFFGALVCYLRPHAAHAANQLSLAHANRASRKAILDEEKKRARMIQQLDLYKANRSHKESAKDIEKGNLSDKCK